MRKYLQFLSKSSIIILVVVISSLLFQAQDSPRIYHDDDPLIDQPTQEYLTHFQPPRNFEKTVITDTAGFDNFDIFVDYAEQSITSNPLNPLQMFFGVNFLSALRGRFTWNGLDWNNTTPTMPSGTCCDPWTASDSLGNLYFGVLHTSYGQYVFKSTDYGNTWGSAVLATSGNDRNTIAADQTAGPYSNYVYSALTPGNFSRSTDFGNTWSQTYTYPNSIPGTMIAVGPNGNVQGGCVIYVTNTGSSENVTYSFHRSTDGGQTFNYLSSMNVAGFVGTLNSQGRLVINNARTRPYPMIAMDNSYGPYRGRLYLVYASNEPAGNGNKPDIKLQYSTDQGATWSSWVRVNDNANPEQSDQWYPAIWCEKTTGTLYIKWYDDREDPVNYKTNVYASFTTNGGQSFAPNQRLGNVTSQYPCPSCAPNQNCYRGDYDGITANPKTSFSIWYDTRNCNYMNVGAYFPDFAMKTSASSISLNNQSDSAFFYVKVPAIKLYTDKVKFTASITPAPTTGTITISFIGKDSLTSYPDSLRVRIKTSGGVNAATYTLNIIGAGSNGTPRHSRNISTVVTPIGIKNLNSEVPKDFYLYQNYPNPFNPVTNIRFDIPHTGYVKLSVYDINGRLVSVLLNGDYRAGKYIVDFKGENLSSGIYLYKIETNGFSDVKKMILIK